METITKKINIYKYDELDEEAKQKAIYCYIDFLAYSIEDITKLSKNSNLYKAVKMAEDMHTPWFTYNYIYDYCEKQILREVKKHKYYEDGGLYE